MFASILAAITAIAELPGKMSELISMIGGIVDAIKQHQRIEKMEEKINQMHDAMTILASAETDEERKSAIKAIGRATNG